MKITGQILKENREKKGISISEVAIATKINNRSLIAMEEGDVENLPPKTFLRGFVRAYASYLELDVDSVMNTFYDEMGSTNPKTPPPVVAPKAKAEGREPNDAINPTTSTAVKIGAVAGILLLVVLIVFFKNKMESYEREAVVEKTPALATGATPFSGTPGPISSPTPSESPASSPTAGATQAPAVVVPATPSPTPVPTAAPTATPTPKPTATPTPTPAPTATPTPKPTATPTPKPTATPTPKPTATPTPKPTATPTPKPTAAATPAPTATPRPSPTPAPTPAATPKPSPAAAAAPGKSHEVLIEALDALDITATIDDEPAKTFRLRGDQVQSIKAKRRVILRLSDGGAVNLIVNGVERGVPGDLGKPLRIDLP